MVFLLFPLVALLTLYAPQILQLFYGNEYASAIWPMQIYAIGVGFLTVFYVLSFALNGAGLVKIPLKLAFFGFLGMIALNFLLIPKWLLVGAALSTTFVSLAITVAILLSVKLHFRVQLSPRTLFASLGSVIILIICYSILPSGHLSFLFSGTVLALLHFALLRFAGELTDADIAPILKIFKKKSLK